MTNLPKMRLLFFLGVLSFLIFSCTPKTTEHITKTKDAATEKISQTKEVQKPKTPSTSIGATAPIPIDPSVRIGTLDNGLKYYIKKNTKPENLAELRMAVNAGSMQEDDDQLGIAHFVEHMCFNGSEHFAKNELVDYLESVGTRFGADLNAYTSFDETVYMLQAKTDDQEKLMKGLLILQDWAGGVTFDPEEIDKERGVVISEWRTRLSANQRMQKVYFPIMYKNSRYAKRLPIGSPEIIENAPYNTVKRFYKDWYRPNLMAVSVVGDFDLDMMEKEIISRFSKLKNPANPRPRKEYDVPKHQETLVSVVSDKEAAFTQVRVMYKHDHIPVKTIKDYREQIVRGLYNSMLNARLTELSQKPNPPFTFSYTGYNRNVGNMDAYSSWAFVAEGGAQRGLETVLEENKRVLDHGFLQSELDRQKIKTLHNIERAFKEKDKTESRRLVMRYIYNFLAENPIPSPKQNLDLYKNLLPTITLDEVNALAAKWITHENRVVVITGPEKETAPLPTEEQVLSAMNKIDNMTTTPYEDKVSDEPLLAKKLSPTPIVSEKKIDGVGITELVLANGVKVVLKPTDYKNDEVRMSASSEGGSSLYSDKDYMNADNAASIVNEAGVANFDNTQLTKMLAGKTVSVYPWIGELYEGMGGSASPDDLETMFQLIYLYFTNPRKDDNALQSFVAKQKSFLKNMMSNPDYYFMNESSKIKSQNHPRRGIPKASDYDKISLDRAFEIYKERFADASDFTFIFVGNFDVEKIKPLLTTYLGNLPSSNRKETWKDVGAFYPPGLVEKEFKKGEAPKSIIDIEFHGKESFDDNAEYQFKSMVDLLRIKLRDAMREDKGGVYFVRVNGDVSKKPHKKYKVHIYFNSKPKNVDDLIKTAMDEIEKIKQNGASDADLTKIKELQKQTLIKNLQDNRYWTRQLSKIYKDDIDPNKITLAELEKMMKTLDSNAIKNAANKYIQKNSMIKIVMNPEKPVDN